MRGGRRHSYFALISAREKSQQLEQALEVLEAMQRQSVVPDVIPTLP